MTFVNLILIQWIVVFIVDISGAVDTLKTFISGILTKGYIHTSDYRLKPIDCSLCTTFWISLIYISITHQFSFAYIAFICFLSAVTPLTLELYRTLYDLFLTILNKIKR